MAILGGITAAVHYAMIIMTNLIGRNKVKYSIWKGKKHRVRLKGG